MPKSTDTNRAVQGAEFCFVTVAARQVSYAEMAVDWALSLRTFRDDPICVVADDLCSAHITSHYPGVFDAILPLPAGYDIGSTTKFCLAKVVDFRRAMFVDADTLVLQDPKRHVDFGLNHPFTMMGAHLPRDTDARHHGYRVSDIASAFDLDAYFTNHSGAFTFEKDFGEAFLDECYRVYVDHLFTLRWRVSGFVGDEVAFGIVGGRRGMQSMPEPTPVMWGREIRGMKPGMPTKPLFHFINTPSPSTLDWLMEGVRARRAEQGFAPVSEPIWRGRASKSLTNKLRLALRTVPGFSR